MIVVVDYGMGNLASVTKALEHLGGKVKVSESPEDIVRADKIVLPGVGAFGDAVRELRLLKLFGPLQDAILGGKPFLGICLGLQLLFPQSDESPEVRGLDIFPGKVKRFQSRGIKIPHMGWNSVSLEKKHPLLKGIPDESYFYFVHSYYAAPENRNLAAAFCRYGRESFAAMVSTETLFATQFHPEKSQKSGLKILKNFIAW